MGVLSIGVLAVAFWVSSCGGPSRRDESVGVAPAASTSSSIGSNDPAPNTKGAASGEDRGAACQIGPFPALASNPDLPDPFERFDGSRVTTKADS